MPLHGPGAPKSFGRGADPVLRSRILRTIRHLFIFCRVPGMEYPAHVLRRVVRHPAKRIHTHLPDDRLAASQISENQSRLEMGWLDGSPSLAFLLQLSRVKLFPFRGSSFLYASRPYPRLKKTIFALELSI